MYINRHLRFTRNYNILAYRHFTGHRTLSKNWLCIVQFSCRRLGAVISYDLLVQYTPFGARRWCVTIAYYITDVCKTNAILLFCFVLLFVWGWHGFLKLDPVRIDCNIFFTSLQLYFYSSNHVYLPYIYW